MRNFWVRLIIKKHLFESSNEYQRSTIGDSPKLEIVFLSISGCFPSPTSWGGDRQQPVQPPPAGVARVGHWQYTGHQHDPFHLVECQAGPAWRPDLCWFLSLRESFGPAAHRTHQAGTSQWEARRQLCTHQLLLKGYQRISFWDGDISCLCLCLYAQCTMCMHFFSCYMDLFYAASLCWSIETFHSDLDCFKIFSNDIA